MGRRVPVGVLAGMIVAVLISFVVSLPSLRLHDDYFIIATFGFQMILFSIFNNWMELTHGPLGVPGIPQPVIFGWHVESHAEFPNSGFWIRCLRLFRGLSPHVFAIWPGVARHSEDEVLPRRMAKTRSVSKSRLLPSAPRLRHRRAAFTRVTSLTLTRQVSPSWNPS